MSRFVLAHESRHLCSWLTFNVRQESYMSSEATIFGVYLFVGLLCGTIALATRSIRADKCDAAGNSEPVFFWILWLAWPVVLLVGIFNTRKQKR